MSIETVFTATKEHLHQLNSTDAVDLFREMVRTEALKFPPGTCKINVPRQDNVADGGIDATVDTGSQVIQSDIIASGKNSYQIKSGKRFEPWQKSKIKKELFGDRRPLNRETLGKRIRDCLNAEGTYVLVCTGINLGKSRTEQTRSHIEKYLTEQCKYENPKIKVWSQDDLINFLDEFPLLVLGLGGLLEAKFKPHWSWSKADSLQVPFVAGQEQKKLVAKIQNELRRKDRAVYIPVWGDPGVGKTRLVLEATKPDDLAPLVVYYRSVSEFESSLLMNAINFNDNLSAIIVIDGCEPHLQNRIWDELKHRGDRIKLITISNSYDKIPEDVPDCKVSPLENEQIREIIQHYEVPKFQADRHTDLCSDSPFMANHVGKVLAHSSGDASEILSQDTIYKSFYIDFGRETPDYQEVKERRRVLRYIALFKRFGFERSVVAEAQAIAQKVGIEWAEFQEIVDDLKSRKILQGEFTLYITPKALHIKLWTEWWDIYGRGFELQEFTQGLTLEQVDWFYEMFKYAAESDAASRIVEDLLGPNGPFRDDEVLTARLESRFFLALTEASPKSALRCLMRIMKDWNKEDFLHFTEGRREAVWALEKIAMWGDLFADAARLLLALGEAENEDCSNNASGVFTGLFSPAYSRGAPTEVVPADRFPILKEAFKSGSRAQRLLALEACKMGLQPMRMWRRTVGAEYQGLRPEPKQWEPKTYGELWDVYRQAWQLLFGQLERLPTDEREKGIVILLEHAPELGQIPTLIDMIVDTVDTLAKKTYVNEKQVMATINSILFHDGKKLPVKSRQRWEKLMNELVGSDFHSMMQRYVGMDLLEDKFDEDRNHVDQAQPYIEKLAQQAVDTLSLLQAELHWLVTSEAQNGYRFGHELGKRDDGFTLLPTLLDAQRNAATNANVSFLGGYFRAIFDKDQPLWEEQLDALIEDTKLNIAISALTRCSSLTDRAGLRLLNLAKNDTIDVNHFGIFFYGKATENLSEEVFTAWIEFLLSARDKFAASIALKLYYSYYVFEKPEPALPRNLTFRLLAHPALFEESNRYRFDTMTDYYWVEIGKAFLKSSPEKSLELVEPMLSHFGHHGSIFSVNSETCSVLNQITEQYPVEVWKQVSKLLEDQIDFSRAVTLEQWLREGGPSARRERKGALTLIPPEKIWEWIDKDVENRTWRFAYRLAPKTLSAEKWPTSLVRAFLIRYGEREDARRNLRANYSTEMWQGSLSLHYENKQQKLLRLKDGEDNENVKRWIDEFVEELEEHIEHAKIGEERE